MGKEDAKKIETAPDSSKRGVLIAALGLLALGASKKSARREVTLAKGAVSRSQSQTGERLNSSSKNGAESV